jgi:uncharacterized membrane protein YqjE
MDDMTRDPTLRRRLPDLFGDVVADGTALFRSEVRLARAEVSDKLNQLTRGLTMLVIGAVLLIPALVVLMTALVAALVEQGTEPALAAAVVGGVALIAGLVLMFAGMRSFRSDNLVPRATIQQLQNDASLAKQQVRT